MRNIMLLLILASLAGCKGTSNSSISTSETIGAETGEAAKNLKTLTLARQKWEQVGPSNYRINISFSGGEHGISNGQRIHEIISIVESGDVTNALQSPSEHSSIFGPYSYIDLAKNTTYTIDDTFDIISSKIKNTLLIGEVSYNSEYGYPESFEYFEESGDEALQFTLNDFYNPDQHTATLENLKSKPLGTSQEYYLNYSISWGFSSVSVNEVFSHVVSDQSIEKYFITQNESLGYTLDKHPSTMAEIYDFAISIASDLNQKSRYAIGNDGHLESIHTEGPYARTDSASHLTILSIKGVE
ncbi:DUF6174 domain-containing protein [Marinagarivorans cellulosilyticus]|uniref:Lipoprotein n=1 Tax=Marinagarivorans cellulosilyticus TaxID=2721545 RepID=A0AAN1WGB6_9GAMM|nr:DUF6174 domain-containing protein [Marinagarivorans cellulosilyticus]BCD97064.1 hypothetical protein MARGE09_P1264 [Marinagarivorans cellulosilyticus]